MIRIAAFFALLVVACSGESCTDPVITPSAYTTSDAVISSESVFIVELSLTCANGAQSVTLYADVNGRQFPVTRGQDVGKYQVWIHMWLQVKALAFTESDLLAECFLSQETGAWNGPWVSTEVVAALIGILVYYLAFSAKSTIQA
ncbi:translocon-associated protein subunit delta [Neolamprologus brichardi]|uniref:translocon-associated protein subunit delta n=1 Tax=Neolamprologus brichardi TaxID=32507 RepID=UPI001643D8F6|nr:translocon-associated protein subunit delta [Neolamprologus brichardi]